MILEYKEFCSKLQKGKSRIMCFDYGGKNTGVALSDKLFMIASPVTTIEESSYKFIINKIETLIEKNEISHLVFGMPYELDGTMGESVKNLKNFLEHFEKKINLPIYLQDERMSSIATYKANQELNLSRKKIEKNLDAQAATYILQTFLDRINRE